MNWISLLPLGFKLLPALKLIREWGKEALAKDDDGKVRLTGKEINKLLRILSSKMGRKFVLEIEGAIKDLKTDPDSE